MRNLREDAKSLSYSILILTTTLDCETKETGSFLSSIAKEIKEKNRPSEKSCCIILGGKTVVHVRERGIGGRTQELALSAVRGISNYEDVVIV